ncbi:hypothetical protein HQ571_03490 [Candidatus Kuenenbacteria bacterium]|nr:hypothetical protein [Candidatus Kuenenbacteria bacterium]
MENSLGLQVLYWFLVVAMYVYTSLCLHFIAKKTSTKHPWLAWIPLVNIFLMLMIGKLSFWWILILFVPLANLIFIIYLWVKITEARGKEKWLGVLMIIPIVNLVYQGWLAFSD